MSVTYCHRLHAFRERACYEVTEHGLRMSVGGKTREFPFADIGAVALDFAPTRFQRNRFRMRIYPKSGGTIEITNESYEGPASFSAHDADYVRFAEALHGAILASGVPAEFRSGNSTAGYLVNIAIVVGTAALLYSVLPLLVAGYGPVGIVGVKLLVIAFMLPTLWRYMKRNRPKTYRPDAIPATALPALSS